MGVRNATILTGSTISATGGVSSTLAVTGQQVPNGLQIADMGVTDFRVRPFLTLRSRLPAIQPNGSWSKYKNQGTLAFPKLLANGEMAFPVGRFEFEPHPEQTDAEVVKMMSWMSQLFFNTNFVNFLKYGSLD